MRELQAAQVAAAFILRAGRPVGALRLTKLMYLAEREAIQRHVYPIVCDDIYAMRLGMAQSRTFDLMKGKPGTQTNGEWARHIGPPSHQGIGVRRGVRESSLDGLSANDIAVIDHVWRTHGGKSKDELIHEVHHGLEEWATHWYDEDKKSSAVQVPYESLFRLLRGMPEDQAADAAAEVAYIRSLADADDDVYAARINELAETASEEGIAPSEESLKDFLEFVKADGSPLRKGALFLLDDGSYQATWRDSKWRLDLTFLGHQRLIYVLLDRTNPPKGPQTGWTSEVSTSYATAWNWSHCSRNEG